MQNLKDKIEGIETLMKENEAQVDVLKSKCAEDIKSIKAKNKEYSKILKKLVETDNSIALIFGRDE